MTVPSVPYRSRERSAARPPSVPSVPSPFKGGNGGNGDRIGAHASEKDPDMKTDPKLTLNELVATLAAEKTRDEVQALTSRGLPLDAVRSGVLGEAMRLFARDQGWSDAALLCDELGRQARMLAHPASAKLATARPAGRA